MHGKMVQAPNNIRAQAPLHVACDRAEQAKIPVMCGNILQYDACDKNNVQKKRPEVILLGVL